MWIGYLDDRREPLARRRAGRRPLPASAVSKARRIAGVLAVLIMAWGTTPAGAQELESDQEAAVEVEVEAALDETSSVVAQFTTGIEDREPIDQVSFVENTVDKVYFFTDLRGFAGQTVTHRWIHAGETMAEVPFEVSGPRWRVWSSKGLLPDWIGDWTVEVLNSAGEVVAAETFTYTAPEA